MRPSALSAVLACSLAAACATSSPDGRSQFVAPAQLGAMYSEVGMRVQLAATADSDVRADAQGLCELPDCAGLAAFERRVGELGGRLSRSAYKLFPGLGERVPEFRYAVARKGEGGTLSTADGEVLVLEGVRHMALGDEALSFVIGREMGHVIGRHHEEDSATGIIVSVVAGLLLPASNFLGDALATFFGSKMLRASYRGDQVREADAIAVQLLADQGSELHDVADALDTNALRLGEDDWSRDLGLSSRRLEQLAWGPRQRLQGAPPAATASLGSPVFP